ncbi:caspase family protein [Cohnella faecalis]|uniref:Peptidase C14 caspase domain-containing protein n=1 Tax=Cohnella faecalis TaxID=2315694 RepID=A0A398CD29_9BACL|nr:caspase family protein [Cohnella faecalis]RIE00620.1 hypothetical protein D3H35_27560 [Cohnella faecalis]
MLIDQASRRRRRQRLLGARPAFSNLKCCVPDAQAVYHLLVDAFLFDPSQIWVYLDSKATSSNIRQAIRYMLSISEPGDVACLYFSGHGGLHSITADTYYQTIIPYSGSYISDWDLALAAESLEPSKVNFTVILDSCQSGGMHEESEHRMLLNPFVMRAISSTALSLRCRKSFLRVTVPNVQAYSSNVNNVRQGDALLLHG